MTRSELIVQLASRFPALTQGDASAAVSVILDAIAEELGRGGRCEIRGFGTFTTHTRPSRQGRNPRTGEPVAIDSKVAPHFKPGKELRERIDFPPAT